MEPFECLSPMDFRYYTGEDEFFQRLKPFVSEEAYIAYQARVEVALIRALAEQGVCSTEAAEDVEQAAAKVTASEVYKEEEVTRHNIRALVNCIRRHLRDPEAGRFVHLFATSNDILDTSSALRLRECNEAVVLPATEGLLKELIRLARHHADTPQIGRTHGQWAVPVTFGYWLSSYVSRLGKRLLTLRSTGRNFRGKLTGAVGAYNALALRFPDPAAFESRVLEILGLHSTEPAVATQIIEPEYMADYAHAVISSYSVLANLADDIRHLHRSEIAEVSEAYGSKRVGSSTMPHKVNPAGFENIKSLWKQYMPRMNTVYMDQISEHQRDLTNSASQRFVPELVTAFVYSAERLTGAMAKLAVNEEAMTANLARSGGEILAEPLYVLLALHGYPDAYEAMRKLSRERRRTGESLADLLEKDPEMQPFLNKFTGEQREILRRPELYIGDAPRRAREVCDHWEKELG